MFLIFQTNLQVRILEKYINGYHGNQIENIENWHFLLILKQCNKYEVISILEIHDLTPLINIFVAFLSRNADSTCYKLSMWIWITILRVIFMLFKVSNMLVS